MQKVKPMLPYLGIILVVFYLLPIVIQGMGSAMLILLIAIPVICFVCALLYGIKNGFNIIFPIVVGLLFIPSLFIFYNETAWVYSVAYLVISLIGNLIGMVSYKNRK